MSKRRIFISFDHDDTQQVSGFMALRNIIDNFDFYNHKLDRRINSSDEDYICRVIREDYIKPASVWLDPIITTKLSESHSVGYLLLV